MTRKPLVTIEDLSVDYAVSKQVGFGHHTLRAVDSVSLEIPCGSVTSLVGESGSGKTSLGRAVARLQAVSGGRIMFEDNDVTTANGRGLASFRRQCQIVFQDPFSSLDPRMTTSEIVEEPLIVHGIGTRQDRPQRVRTLLDWCGLDSRHLGRKPHELSGGQRQRVGIARALAVEPKLLICDEPVSALDASVQAQILNLLMDLKEELGLTYLFIAHNLGVIRHISDQVAIMYLGKIVETGTRDAVFANARHPYTRALLSAAPIPDPAKERAAKRNRIVLRGEIPSASNPPSGCAFHTRCWLYQQLGEPERCRTEQVRSPTTGQARSSCHFEADLPPTNVGSGSPACHSAEPLDGETVPS